MELTTEITIDMVIELIGSTVMMVSMVAITNFGFISILERLV